MDLKGMGLVPLIIDIDDDIIKPLFAKEGDYRSRGISLQILNKGKEIDTTGIIVEFFAKPRDGKVYVVEATPVDTTKGKYEIVYPSSILQPGIVKCEIRLVKMTDDEIDEIITTKSFNLKVYETIADEDIFEGIDIEPIVEILVQAARNEEERIVAENQRIQAENTRIQNENERKSNEQIRQQKEDERQQNEITRQTNEQTRQQNEQQRIALYNALKDLDVSQYELRLQKLEHDTSVEETVVEEAYGPVIPLPESAVNGQINEIKIFGNTEAEEDNVKSTLGAIRLKSVGKNLFNYKNFSENTGVTIEYIDNGFRLKTSGGTWGTLRYKNIKLKPNVQYTISRNIQIIAAGTSSWNGTIRVFIAGTTTALGVINRTGSDNKIVFTAPPTGLVDIWIYVTGAVSEAAEFIFTNVQLEEGAAATTYESYKESTLYVLGKNEEGNILELRSLPNGTKDEVNISERKLIKRIEVKSNITSGTIINFADMAEGGTYYAWNDNGETETGTKGDTLGINATVLIYQLAEPEIIPVQITGSLQAYENGTMYIDAIIPMIDFYDINGIAVDVPIGTIDTLYKVDKETGYLYSLDISQAEISQDRLSFIHPDLVEGDLVDWDYEPALESTNPAISMKLPTNLKASINSALEGIKDLYKQTYNLNIRVTANRQEINNDFNKHKENVDDYIEHLIKNRLLGNKTKYIAHRGASRIAPENTLPAYEKAGELGFWGAECDVLVSADGVWVLHHDDTVDRMTNGTGYVSSLTLAQLKALTIDAGNNIAYYPNLKIPTLEEYLLICKKWGIVPVIEIKPATYTNTHYDIFVDLLKKMNLESKAIVISFNQNVLTEIRNRNKYVQLQLVSSSFSNDLIDFAKALGNTMLDLKYDIITQSIIEECHTNDIMVNAWTVNDYNIAKTLRNYGVDFITTDFIID